MNPTKVWVRRRGDDYAVYDAIFHRNEQGFLIMELEPALTQENIPLSQLLPPGPGFHWPAGVLYHQPGGFLQRYRPRGASGSRVFDRVMLYKFDDDGHGEVLAEEKLDDMESYLGLHFPESDVPQPARKMFLSKLDSRHPQRPCRPGGPDPRHQSRHPSAHGSGHVHPAAALPLATSSTCTT